MMWGVFEVKTGAYGVSDLRGLAKALPHHRPLILCDPGHEEPVLQAEFTAVVWMEFWSDRW